MSTDSRRFEGNLEICAWCAKCQYRSLYRPDGTCLWCDRRIVKTTVTPTVKPASASPVWDDAAITRWKEAVA